MLWLDGAQATQTGCYQGIFNCGTVEKQFSEKLVENVHMQGFRNRGPARRVGSPSEARTNSEE